ncbi:MAG: nicotinamide-nucleotide amidohydrolase family protein [Sphingobacterium sp.]|jgi:PncC family amidohydrolase|nr:nicotinamide-nucleotide amidohydrolase family protein [Sphingobacterium sp.]
MIKMEFPKSLLEQIKSSLANSHGRVAVAESVTSGVMQFACSQIKNATNVFAGGITVYAPDEKIRLLGVDPLEAKRCDCVSPLVTQQMAISVSTLFQTDWGIATTGYATIVKESKGKLFAFFSIAYQSDILLTEKVELEPTTMPEEAQFIYTSKALQAFNSILTK